MEEHAISALPVIDSDQHVIGLITADAIIPRHSGANNLNSVEYFRLVRGALKDDGVALHWNGGATDTEYKLILRALVEVFPEATLWGDGSLMVGSSQPMTLSRIRVEAMLADPALRELLGLMNVTEVDHLVKMFRAGPDDIRAFLGQGVLLSDDRPLLEYYESLPQDEGNPPSLQNHFKGTAPHHHGARGFLRPSIVHKYFILITAGR